MNKILMGAALPALLAAGALGTSWASHSGAAALQGSRLKKVPAQVDPTPADQVDAVDESAWRDQLSESDLDRREQNLERVIAQARRDPGVREMLERWAAKESDSGLAWTSRLALRELKSRARGFPDMGGGSRSGRALPFDMADPEELLRDFWSEMPGFGRDFDPRFAPPGAPPAGGPGSTSNSESFSLSSGPDGVKCTVTRDVDGEQVTENYEADSLDELLEAHPELRGKLGSNQFQVFGLDGQQGGTPNAWRLHIAPDNQRESAEAPVRTDILGVVVRALTPEESSKLGLAGEQGLHVERVEPGTIAQSLGVQRGHVLVEMNGHALKSRDDISGSLSARGENDEVTVVLLDRWGQRRTRTWKPEPKAAPESVKSPEQKAREL